MYNLDKVDKKFRFRCDKICFKTSYHNNFHFQSSRLQTTSSWAIYPGRGCLNPGVLRPQQHPLDVPCSFGQVTKVVNVTQLLTQSRHKDSQRYEEEIHAEFSCALTRYDEGSCKEPHTALLMVKPSKAFVPQAEDSARKIFQVESLFASLLSKRETDRILKFSFQCTVGKMT